MHSAQRDALLDHIVALLRADERFVAAWLTGSFGRGEEDAYSDLDFNAVVAAPHDQVLCTRPWQNAGRTTPERLALLRRFGTPVVVHEAHRNAPEGGTHTNVLYESGLELDLNLIPLDRAQRPALSRLLFDQASVPMEPHPPIETLEERRERIGQQIAIFWIMASVTAKYRLRGWDVSVHSMLDALHGQVATVRRLIDGTPPRFRRYAPDIPLATTSGTQAAAIRAVCAQMESLAPGVARLGVIVPDNPRTLVEQWLGKPIAPAAAGSPHHVVAR